MDCWDQILKRRTLGGQAAVPIVHEEHIGIQSVFLRMAQKSVHLIVKVQVCLFVRRTVVICVILSGCFFMLPPIPAAGQTGYLYYTRDLARRH